MFVSHPFLAISAKKSWPSVKLSGSPTTRTNTKTSSAWWGKLCPCWRERSEWVQHIAHPLCTAHSCRWILNTKFSQFPLPTQCPTLLDYGEVLLKLLPLEGRTTHLFSYICELSLLFSAFATPPPAKVACAALLLTRALHHYGNNTCRTQNKPCFKKLQSWRIIHIPVVGQIEFIASAKCLRSPCVQLLSGPACSWTTRASPNKTSSPSLCCSTSSGEYLLSVLTKLVVKWFFFFPFHLSVSASISRWWLCLNAINRPH